MLANWLLAVIHQLVAAPGVDIHDYQLAAKFMARTETHPSLLLRDNITSFDVHWKTDSRVDQLMQRTEEGCYYSNTIQNSESLLHCAVALRQNAQVCCALRCSLYLTLRSLPF
jgi:hypothetical protein